MDDEEYPNKETKELFEGVENGDEEVVKVLLLGNKNKQFELDLNFQFKHKKVCDGCVHFFVKDGYTALHIAAERGDEKIVDILIEHGSNVDLQTTFGWTALHIAANKGFEQIVKILVEHGSNVDLQTDGTTALRFAASNGSEEIAKILVEHGANVHLQDTVGGWTALHQAAFKGFEQIVKILVEHGSDIHLQTKNGRTVFDIAKNQKIVELIIQLQGPMMKPARQTKKEN